MALRPDFSKSSGNKKKEDARFNWNVFLVILLLLLIVGLPLAISVWDVGMPVKGYN